MTEKEKDAPEPIQTAPVAPVQLGTNLDFTRSADFKTIYSDVFRTRIGNGDVTIIFSKARHLPSLLVNANIIEEQAEVVMTWPQLKMLEETLRTLVDAIDHEIGEIPMPSAFKVNAEGQHAVVRTLGYPSPKKKINE